MGGSSPLGPLLVLALVLLHQVIVVPCHGITRDAVFGPDNASSKPSDVMGVAGLVRVAYPPTLWDFGRVLLYDDGHLEVYNATSSASSEIIITAEYGVISDTCDVSDQKCVIYADGTIYDFMREVTSTMPSDIVPVQINVEGLLLANGTVFGVGIMPDQYHSLSLDGHVVQIGFGHIDMFMVLVDDGRVFSWSSPSGNNFEERTNWWALQAPIHAIHMSHKFACALNRPMATDEANQRTLIGFSCRDAWESQSFLEYGNYVDVSSSWGYVCAVSGEGELSCWGSVYTVGPAGDLGPLANATVAKVWASLFSYEAITVVCDLEPVPHRYEVNLMECRKTCLNEWSSDECEVCDLESVPNRYDVNEERCSRICLGDFTGSTCECGLTTADDETYVITDTCAYGACDLSFLVCGHYIENWSCTQPFDSTSEQLVFHANNCSCTIDCKVRVMRDESGACSVCKPCDDGSIPLDWPECQCSTCSDAPVPGPPYIIKLPENNCTPSCGWGMTQVGESCECVLPPHPGGLYHRASPESQWCSWDCSEEKLISEGIIVTRWEEFDGDAFAMSPSLGNVSTWISSTSVLPWQATWDNSAWPYSGRQCMKKCKEGRRKGHGDRCNLCTEPLLECGEDEVWDSRACACACKPGYIRPEPNAACRLSQCAGMEICGPGKILNPHTCICECVPYYDSQTYCETCAVGRPTSDPSFIFGPHELTNTTKTIHEVMCTWGCADLWQRDPITGLCEVCNPRGSACPDGKVVDYTTCTCIDGYIGSNGAALLQQEIGQPISLLDCGSGVPDHHGKSCVCPLGFTGATCRMLDDAWRAPFYHWGPVAFTSPYCWSTDGGRNYILNGLPLGNWIPGVDNPDLDGSMAMSRQWVKIVAGENHFCALTTGQEVWCWSAQDVYYGPDTTFPGFAFPIPSASGGGATREDAIDVSSGGNRTCVIYSDRSAECWPIFGSGPTFNFDQVYAIDTEADSACAVTFPNREIECQGTEVVYTSSSEEQYHTMACATGFCCSLVYSGPKAGGLHCWGTFEKEPQAGEHYIQVDVADNRVCALRSVTNSSITPYCWRQRYGWSSEPMESPRDPDLFRQPVKISLYGTTAAVLGQDGVISLHQVGEVLDQTYGSTPNHTVPYIRRWVDVAAGKSHTCGLVSNCGSQAMPQYSDQGCYCPFMRSGVLCEEYDCDRYWVMSKVFPSYVHGEWEKYCDPMHFDRTLCLFHQYSLDANYRMLQRTLGMTGLFSPVTCPPDQNITFSEWHEAWEECTNTDISVYCDTVLFSGSDVRDIILPFDQHNSELYEWNPSDVILGSEQRAYPNIAQDAEYRLARVLFDNSKDALLEGLKYRLSTGISNYSCLVNKLHSVVWEPEQFAYGCAQRSTWQYHSSVMGAPTRSDFVINQLVNAYDDSFESVCQEVAVKLVPFRYQPDANSTVDWRGPPEMNSVGWDVYWKVKLGPNDTCDTGPCVTTMTTVAIGDEPRGIRIQELGDPYAQLSRYCELFQQSSFGEPRPGVYQIRCPSEENHFWKWGFALVKRSGEDTFEAQWTVKEHTNGLFADGSYYLVDFELEVYELPAIHC